MTDENFNPIILDEASIDTLVKAFEDISNTDSDDNNYWFARELMSLLGYSKWENFQNVIEKAKRACLESGHDANHHFPDVRKMVALGSGSERMIEDIALSRYASYLIAQNGDPRKKSIAFAQTYFAIQTRRQEILDNQVTEVSPLSEDERRLMLRDEIKEHNKSLASAAKSAGVVTPFEYSVFQTHGYQGLYGGLNVPGIRRKKGLSKNKSILDFMGSTELAANLFRATQTEEKIRREGIKGKTAANKAHKEVGAKVRQTIKEIGGTMPEDLSVAEDIKKIARRSKKGLSEK